MASWLHHISVKVPDHAYSQQVIREQMKELVANTERQKRILHRIYSASGIETRHSVLDDFKKSSDQRLFYNGHGSSPGTSPGTGIRNQVYREKGREMFVEAARTLLQESGTEADEITHLITISCTGFYAPGPDFDIIRALDLDPATERYHLGFMGCYAAIPGLKLASRLCRANPDASVMVIAAELCTLHFQHGASIDEMISASVFADGAAAALVTSRKRDGPAIEITGFASTLTEEGSDDMAWTIGDTGFDMTLSTYIPELLGRNLDRFLDPLLENYRLNHQQIDYWAVHPGGRAILDKVQTQLEIPADKMAHSRKVLAEYGNMSSVTILFVLRGILKEPEPADTDRRILAMAFGPGLTLESTLLVKHG